MNYVTSKDYEQLWSLVQEGKKIPCLYQDDGIQRAGIAQKVCGEPAPPDGAFCGVGLVDSTKDIFIMYCTKMHVEILLPDNWIRIESDKDLPQPRQWVLVTDGKEICHVFWNGEAWDDDRYFYNRKTFTHWKPLPEPPRE